MAWWFLILPILEARHLRSGLRSRGTVSVSSKYGLSAGLVHKTEYWGTVTLGTPAQEFTVIFDTGSGNLILPGECNSAACDKHRKYNASKSSTSKRLYSGGSESESDGDGHATITFGTGQVSGDFYRDRLCLGSSCAQSSFIAATAETEQPFIATSFDGIMGLAFSELSMGDGFNIVDDLRKAHALPNNQFSVFLTDAGNSEITFGGYKADLLASNILWAPVQKQVYWQIDMDDIAMNNKNTGFCKGGCQVAVDTGTSMLAGPSDMIEMMEKALQLKEDCSNFHEMPLLGFSVGGRVLNLMPNDYIDKSEGSCSTSFMALDVPPPRGPLFVFGDPFLRRFVTIYDRDGPQVGFAVANQGPDSAELSKKLLGELVNGNAAAMQTPVESSSGTIRIELAGDSGQETKSDPEPVTADSTPAPAKEMSTPAPMQTEANTPMKKEDFDAPASWSNETPSVAKKDEADAPVSWSSQTPAPVKADQWDWSTPKEETPKEGTQNWYMKVLEGDSPTKQMESAFKVHREDLLQRSTHHMRMGVHMSKPVRHQHLVSIELHRSKRHLRP